MIPLGAWTPDLPSVKGPLLVDAKNVTPHPQGYKPFLELTNGSQALPLVPQGAASFRDGDLTSHIYAGDATDIYELDVDGTWIDRSRTTGGTYNTTTNEVWNFAQFGNFCVATNGIDDIQSIDMTSGTNFAALAGSPPTARHLATFDDFLFIGNTGTSAQNITWSAINDITGWTSGTDQSGAQTFPDGGAVQGFAVHDTLTIFQRYKIRRCQYVGPPIIMQFDVISEEKGALVDGSICSQGAYSFFLANDGFFQLLGDQLTPIGADKVDIWFFNDINQEYIQKMTGEVDPQSKVAYWTYASTNSSDGTPDTVIMYNWTARRWCYARTQVELLLNVYGLGYTLDGLDTLTTDLDNFNVPLDDPVLTGGTLSLNGFGGTYQIGPFSGDALAVTTTSGDFEFNKGQRTYVSGVEPIVDNTAATVAVAAKDRLGSTVSFDTAMSQEINGFTSQDATGRYHRIQIAIAAAETWTDLSGYNLRLQMDGET